MRQTNTNVPSKFGLPEHESVNATTNLPHRDWPHAPVHRLSENGVYFITAATLYKKKLFDTTGKLEVVESMLLSGAKEAGWQIEAWAILSNHYHFVARGDPISIPLGRFLQEFHSKSSIAINKVDGVTNRRIWYNFRDTKLTSHYSYL